jgi:hypothetical protein
MYKSSVTELLSNRKIHSPLCTILRMGCTFLAGGKTGPDGYFVSEKYNNLYRICHHLCSLNIFKIRYKLCKNGMSDETMLSDTLCEAPSLMQQNINTRTTCMFTKLFLVQNRFRIRKLEPYDTTLLKYKVPNLLQHGPQFLHLCYKNK